MKWILVGFHMMIATCHMHLVTPPVNRCEGNPSWCRGAEVKWPTDINQNTGMSTCLAFCQSLALNWCKKLYDFDEGWTLPWGRWWIRFEISIPHQTIQHVMYVSYQWIPYHPSAPVGFRSVTMLEEDPTLNGDLCNMKIFVVWLFPLFFQLHFHLEGSNLLLQRPESMNSPIGAWGSSQGWLLSLSKVELFPIISKTTLGCHIDSVSWACNRVLCCLWL